MSDIAGKTLRLSLMLACLTTFVAGFLDPVAAQPDEPLGAIEVLSPRSHLDDNGVVSVEAFAGSSLPLRWLVRRPVESSLRAELDIFLASSATVVPLEKGIVLAEDVQAAGGNPCEIAYQFAIPDSESPLRYLLRLRVISDDGNEGVQAQTVLVSAVVDDVLLPLKGRKVYLVGFENSVQEKDWRGVLTDAGVALEDGTTTTSAKSGSRTGEPQQGLVMVRCSAGGEVPGDVLKNHPRARVLLLYDSAQVAAVTVVGKREGGARMRAGIDRLRQLQHSPSHQKTLVQFFTGDLSAAPFYLPEN